MSVAISQLRFLHLKKAYFPSRKFIYLSLFLSFFLLENHLRSCFSLRDAFAAPGGKCWSLGQGLGLTIYIQSRVSYYHLSTAVTGWASGLASGRQLYNIAHTQRQPIAFVCKYIRRYGRSGRAIYK